MRIDSLRTILRKAGASESAVIALFSPSEVRWASNFSGSAGILLLSASEAVLFTDSRYAQQVNSECDLDSITPAIVSSIAGAVTAYCKEKNVSEILYDPGSLPHSKWIQVDQEVRPAWTSISDQLKVLIASKTSDEINAIKKAVSIAENAMQKVLGEPVLGSSEREISAKLVFHMIEGGAERPSFDPIVASGPNSAMPHVRPSDRTIKEGDTLLIDWGCIVDGYASDITRTYFVGTPSFKQKQFYAFVLEGNNLGISQCRSGRLGSEVDATVRDHLDQLGVGDKFAHSLGHGVGMDVHEWPGLTKRRDDLLPENCVVTIEPGLYLPGEFGIRIEDMIRLSGPDEPAEVLTTLPKDLAVLTR